jgi:hypothetical protein
MDFQTLREMSVKAVEQKTGCEVIPESLFNNQGMDYMQVDCTK